MIVLTGAVWRTSSHSSDNGAACVEVATDEVCGVVAIRDSKDPHGPVLAVPPAQWRAFLARLAAGRRPGRLIVVPSPVRPAGRRTGTGTTIKTTLPSLGA